MSDLSLPTKVKKRGAQIKKRQGGWGIVVGKNSQTGGFVQEQRSTSELKVVPTAE